MSTVSEKVLGFLLPDKVERPTGEADFRLIALVNLAWGIWASIALFAPVIILAGPPIFLAHNFLKYVKKTGSKVDEDKRLGINDDLAQKRVRLLDALTRGLHWAAVASIPGALWLAATANSNMLLFLLPGFFLNVASIVAAFALAVTTHNTKQAEEELEKGVMRGTHLMPVTGFRRTLARVQAESSARGADALAGVIPLGGDLYLPTTLEPLHFLVMGSTGTGKSVLLKQAIANIRARGDVAVILDVDGQLSKSHARPGDKTWRFVPDESSVKWNPLIEIKDENEARALAESIIPEGEGNSHEWNQYARGILTDALRLAFRHQMPFGDLIEILGDTAQLKDFILTASGTLSSKVFFQGDASNMVGSVLNIVATYAHALAALPSDADFSIKKFVSDAQHEVLWVVVKEKELAAALPVITSMFDLAASGILETDTSSPRPRWLIIDEFGSFNPMAAMFGLLTKGRKYGARVVLGIQDVTQIYAKYGKEGGTTLLSNLSNFVALRCADPDTAEYASRRIGDTQISRTTRSHNNQGASSSESVVIERAVLPSQIQNLPDLSGYAVASGVGVSSIRLQV